jgi:hypothetical protein
MDEFRERQLLRLKLGLPDEYIFKQCDEGEKIIAESILTGERIRWNGRPVLGEIQLRRLPMICRRPAYGTTTGRIVIQENV